ncbi:MAG: FecR family protein [gamma proteobacterium symbiont of Taylorina sp.]|nr:FecR family protein [gamma proteobacterium symbiont of Taylorina sp.]
MYQQFFIALLLVFSSSIAFAVVPDISGTWNGTEFSNETVCDDEEEDTITGFYISQEGINFVRTSSSSYPDGEFSETIYSGTIDESGVISGTYSYDGSNSSGALYSGSGSLNGNYDSCTGDLILNYNTSENSYTFSDGSSFPGGCAGKGGQLKLTRSDSSNVSNTCLETNVSIASVQETIGTAYSVTPITLISPTTFGTVPDSTALLTLADSATTIKRNDESVVEVKANSVVVLNPANNTNNTITLIKGEVTFTVDCSDTQDFEVRAAIANIKVPVSCTSILRATGITKFTANYSQSGTNGTLTVSVASGTVDITGRDGSKNTLTAGQEKIIQNTVPRTTWVLPIDNDKIYGGETNIFIWTEYPNADGYLLEVNLPSPDFSESNASSVQFANQTATLKSTNYTIYDGLVIFTLPLPKGADGIVVEIRLFALDANGNIIGESVSSDSSTVAVQD